MEVLKRRRMREIGESSWLKVSVNWGPRKESHGFRTDEGFGFSQVRKWGCSGGDGKQH